MSRLDFYLFTVQGDTAGTREDLSKIKVLKVMKTLEDRKPNVALTGTWYIHGSCLLTNKTRNLTEA